MPFRTRYGSHYHMEEGCHGATIPCDTNGLEPCSDCCDTKGDGSGGMPVGGAGGGGMPIPRGNSGTGSAPSPAPDGRGDNDDDGTGEGGVDNDDRPLAQVAKDMSEDGAKGVKEGMSAPAVDRKDVAANLVRTQAEREAYALVSRVENADEYRRGRIRTDLERIEAGPNYMRFVHGGYLTSAQNAAEGM